MTTLGIDRYQEVRTPQGCAKLESAVDKNVKLSMRGEKSGVSGVAQWIGGSGGVRFTLASRSFEADQRQARQGIQVPRSGPNVALEMLRDGSGNLHRVDRRNPGQWDDLHTTGHFTNLAKQNRDVSLPSSLNIACTILRDSACARAEGTHTRNAPRDIERPQKKERTWQSGRFVTPRTAVPKLRDRRGQAA